MLTVKTYIKSSGIHGIGLFASENIKEGQLVGQLNQFDLRIHIGDIKENELDFFRFYCSLEGEYYQTYFDNMRFMNHSSDHNCIDTPDGKTIAIRDISIGEELTCDYSLICDMWK